MIFNYADPEVFKTSFGPHMMHWPKPEDTRVRYLVLDRGSMVAMSVVPYGNPGSYVASTFRHTFPLPKSAMLQIAAETTFDGIANTCKLVLPKAANHLAGNTMYLFYHAVATEFRNVEVTEVAGHPNCRVVDLTAWACGLVQRKEPVPVDT